MNSTKTTETAFRVFRDGKPIHVRHATEDEAFAFLLRWQPQSTDWAIKHEGYEIREVPADKWSDEEAAELRATARRVIRDHGHDGYWDEMTRDSCGACALGGWGESDEYGPLMPNYAGWARLYVEAGLTIPVKWADGFRAEQNSDNTAYAAALALSVATFGVKIG